MRTKDSLAYRKGIVKPSESLHLHSLLKKRNGLIACQYDETKFYSVIFSVSYGAGTVVQNH